MMCPSSMGDTANNLVFVRVRDAYGVVTSGAQTPHTYLVHVEDLLLLHPSKDAVPESVRAFGILWIGRAVCGSRDLRDDASPSPFQKLIGALGIIRTVAI